MRRRRDRRPALERRVSLRGIVGFAHCPVWLLVTLAREAKSSEQSGRGRRRRGEQPRHLDRIEPAGSGKSAPLRVRRGRRQPSMCRTRGKPGRRQRARILRHAATVRGLRRSEAVDDRTRWRGSLPWWGTARARGGLGGAHRPLRRPAMLVRDRPSSDRDRRRPCRRAARRWRRAASCARASRRRRLDKAGLRFLRVRRRRGEQRGGTPSSTALRSAARRHFPAALHRHSCTSSPCRPRFPPLQHRRDSLETMHLPVASGCYLTRPYERRRRRSSGRGLRPVESDFAAARLPVCVTIRARRAAARPGRGSNCACRRRAACEVAGLR